MNWRDISSKKPHEVKGTDPWQCSKNNGKLVIVVGCRFGSLTSTVISSSNFTVAVEWLLYVVISTIDMV